MEPADQHVAIWRGANVCDPIHTHRPYSVDSCAPTGCGMTLLLDRAERGMYARSSGMMSGWPNARST